MDYGFDIVKGSRKGFGGRPRIGMSPLVDPVTPSSMAFDALVKLCSE